METFAMILALGVGVPGAVWLLYRIFVQIPREDAEWAAWAAENDPD